MRTYLIISLLIAAVLIGSCYKYDNPFDPENDAAETVETPTFNPPGGTFAVAQPVTISCATSGASIYYTTDGTSPTQSSNFYTSPVSISATTTLKAIAIRSGYKPSPISSANYTLINATVLPFNEGFEGSTANWSFINSEQTNKPNNWFVGTAAAFAGSKSAYISQDNGATNTYATHDWTWPVDTIVHLYRNFLMPASSSGYTLKFRWKCVGEANWDYMTVHLVDPSLPINFNTQVSGGQIGLARYETQSSWVQATISITASQYASVKRLVFSWKNDGSGGTQPPAAVDNIEFYVNP